MSIVETVMTKCDSKGCAHAPLYAPKINVPLEGMSLDQSPPLEAILGLRLCDRHIGEVAVKDFSNMEPLFEQLASGQTAGLKIDWSRAFFSKVKIDSDEYKKFEGMAS